MCEEVKETCGLVVGRGGGGGKKFEGCRVFFKRRSSSFYFVVGGGEGVLREFGTDKVGRWQVRFVVFIGEEKKRCCGDRDGAIVAFFVGWRIRDGSDGEIGV